MIKTRKRLFAPTIITAKNMTFDFLKRVISSYLLIQSPFLIQDILVSRKFMTTQRFLIKRQRRIHLRRSKKRKIRDIASKRVLNENVIGKVKRFKVVAERYRNRRKRFALRFNIIAGIYNFELVLG